LKFIVKVKNEKSQTTTEVDPPIENLPIHDRGDINYRELIEQLKEGILVAQDNPLRLVFANSTLAEITGYTESELLSLSPNGIAKLIHSEDRSLFFQRFRNRLAGKPVVEHYEFRSIRKDGNEIWLAISANRIVYKGEPAVVAMFTDVTDRKRMEISLKQSEQKLKAQFKGIPIPTYIWQKKQNDFILIDFNHAAELITEGKIMQIIGTTACALYHDSPEILQDIFFCYQQQSTFQRDILYQFRTTGETKNLTVTYGFLPPDMIIVHTLDITNIRKAEQSLRETESKWRLLYENLPGGSFVVTNEFKIEDVNDLVCNLTGYSKEELIGQYCDIICPKGPHNCPIFDLGQPQIDNDETAIKTRDGYLIPIIKSARRIPLGKKELIVENFQDITKLKHAEAELAIRFRYERGLAECSNTLLSYHVDGNKILTEALQHLLDASNVSRVYIFENFEDDVDGLCVRQVAEVCAPGVKTEIFNPVLKHLPYNHGFNRWQKLLAQDKTIQGLVKSFPKAEQALLNSQQILSILVLPIWVGSKWYGFIGFDDTQSPRIWNDEDIQLLQTAANMIGTFYGRKIAEQQLIQSQKMEAIGTLAGGIAHDFNNILTGIIGYGDLLWLKHQNSMPINDDIETVRKISKRATSLTRQLLAFSRRQIIEPKTINLNKLIINLKKMLRRIIGEDIDLQTKLETSLAAILADPGLIEQVIMNLSINARDAMPNGGKLIIKTENLTLSEATCDLIPDSRPGDYVHLTVTDTGTGMEREVLAHIFEPFFTTKSPEKGTGLGLSVVYGIVKQHNGLIQVVSAPGQGTTFNIYFPAIPSKFKQEKARKKPVYDIKGEGKRVLVVEDDEVVREFVRNILQEKGFVVFEAETAKDAHNIFLSEEQKIDILFCDVILPDQNGVELADEFRKLNPHISILLTSGYTDQKLQWALIKKKGYRFLQKPFALADLFEAIKDTMAQIK